MNLLIIALLFLTTAFSVTFYIILKKLRKINTEISQKNEQIRKINKELEEANRNLAEKNGDLAQKLTASELFFKTLIESADDGIAFYDNGSNLRFANKAFYSILGMTENEYFQCDPDSLIHPDDRDYTARKNHELGRNGIFEGELKVKHKKDYYVVLLTKSVIIPDREGNISGSLTISRDISWMKKQQEKIIKAKNEAEIGNRLKSNFLANISHEIRTPLNSVVGFANLLYDNNISEETRQEYIEHINYNSEKLLQIISDIIDLSRLESSQLEISYEENSVGEIVNEVVEETRRTIKRNEKPIVLTFRNMLNTGNDLIFTDKVWLKRMLGHLLDNAVKFTAAGLVELTCGKEEQNLFFVIKDTGIGISKENFSRIFEKFNQEVNGHQRPFEGLGIGLTLVKEVLEKMGGKISVKSEKGLGSEFRFTIPYRPAGATVLRLPTIEKMSFLHEWRSKKCLIVDDNREVLKYIYRILLDTGIDVLEASSGTEALNIIRTNPGIDVVLLDMQMPGMNGIEVAKAIRQMRKNLPVIAQTAFIFENDRDIILEAGCDACLIKPIRKEHLISTLSMFLKSP